MKHLMAIGDGPLSGTGFGEELRNILYRLAQSGDYEVHWQDLQHFGYPIDLPASVFPDLSKKKGSVRLWGGTLGDSLKYGADAFLKNYREINPELVLFMGDPRNIVFYRQFKQKLGFPLVFYVTLDGLPIHPAWLENLQFANLLVAMTEWAADEYRKVGFSPAWIHHGVNCKWWQTTPEQHYGLRRKLEIPDDVVVFGNWDVPQHRKRTDALLRCWKEFNKKERKAVLLLYNDWSLESSLGWSIQGLIDQYKIPQDNILDPITIQGSPKFWNQAERPEHLKGVVAMTDIWTSTTSGEGFGKTGLEAMAMSCPAIITDYSACSEVHRKGSILVPTYEGRAGRYRMDDRRRSVEAGIVNEAKFVEAMEYLYEDENERRRLGCEAQRWAKEFDYDRKILPQWKLLLNGLDTDLIMAKELLNI